MVQLLELHQATRDLATSQSRYRALCKASPLGVIATDAAGACNYTNDRWQAIFNLTNKEAAGNGWVAICILTTSSPSTVKDSEQRSSGSISTCSFASFAPTAPPSMCVLSAGRSSRPLARSPVMSVQLKM